MDRDALLVVDVQNDFCEGGSLEVSGASEIIPVINRLMDRFELVVATQDYHPSNHCSFDVLWPVHCVAGTDGAELCKGLSVDRVSHFVRKGMSEDRDAYSGFQETGLSSLLKARGINTIFVCGLATDYCIKATALDGLREGFNVFVVTDGIRAVTKDTGKKALKEMEDRGVKLVTGDFGRQGEKV